MYRTTAQILNKLTGYDVASIDYRYAPNVFPAALDDAFEAYQFYSNYYNDIIIIGDSAGGNLSLALGLKIN